MAQLVRAIFRTYTVDYWLAHHGSMAGATVCDRDSERCFFVNRGTGGTDLIGTALSWLHDLFVVKNSDGAHRGFARVAREAMSRFTLTDTPKHAIFTGTSMGAATSVQEAYLYYKANVHSRIVEFISFSGPPPGDAAYSQMVTAAIDSGGMKGKLYVMPQDPVSSRKLRRQNNVFLDGVDVGSIILLPDINLYDGTPGVGLINHSGRQWNAALSLFLNMPSALVDSEGRAISPPFVVRTEDRALLSLLGTLISN
jgi:hypothetical protein